MGIKRFIVILFVFLKWKLHISLYIVGSQSPHLELDMIGQSLSWNFKMKLTSQIFRRFLYLWQKKKIFYWFVWESVWALCIKSIGMLTCVKLLPHVPILTNLIHRNNELNPFPIYVSSSSVYFDTHSIFYSTSGYMLNFRIN